MNETQEITLKNRTDLEVTGVKKLYSLDSNLFVIETSLGKMRVGGTDLEMLQLDIERGVLVISGNVSLIEYSDNIKTKKSDTSFIAKLFK